MTYAASLIHWIDSLAGTSGGKTVPIYQDLWSRRFGDPTAEDLHAIRSYVEARGSRYAQISCPSLPPPGDADGFGWRARFLYAALEARDLASFLDIIRPCLAANEGRELEDAIEHFRPGFDLFWKEESYLQSFQLEFQNYLRAGGLPEFLAEVARFFDVDPSSSPPPVLCFVLLPSHGSTHAQALGGRLLIEVRPGDEPADQVQVVAHEGSHFLFELVPRERLAALERRARAAGRSGSKVWRLLQEALPTALGQGLAVARLTPRSFDRRLAWYHVAEIDRLAKRIYPILRREIEAGRTIDGPFIELVVRDYDQGGH